jgi:putative FmdB family regulatory protein
VPTYQYACTECGGQLEAVQKFTDEPLTVHDDCGGRLRKVYSPVGIVFKGSGFYRTDSRGSSSAGAPVPATNGKESNGKESSGKESSAAASSGSSESSSSGSSSSGSSSTSGGDSKTASKASSSASGSSGKGSSGEKVA